MEEDFRKRKVKNINGKWVGRGKDCHKDRTRLISRGHRAECDKAQMEEDYQKRKYEIPN